MAATEDTTAATPPANDAYTGMLGISLIALIIGCLLLYLDYSQYPDSKPPVVPKAPAIAVPNQPEAPPAAPPKEAAQPKAANPPVADVPADKE